MLSKKSSHSNHSHRGPKPPSSPSIFSICSRPDIPQNPPASPKQKYKNLGKISIKQSKQSSLKPDSCRSITSLPEQKTIHNLRSPVFQHNMGFFSKNEQTNTNHMSSQAKDKSATVRYSLNVRSSEQQLLDQHFIKQPYDYQFNKRMYQNKSANQKKCEFKLQNKTKKGIKLLSTLADSKEGKVFETFSSFAPPAKTIEKKAPSFQKDQKLLQNSLSLQNSIIFEPQTLNIPKSHQYFDHHRTASSNPPSLDPLSPTFYKPVLGRLSVRRVHSIHGQESTTSLNQSIVIQDFESMTRKAKLNQMDSWNFEDLSIEI